MATKTQVILIDDLTNVEADETVTFALDGVNYSIDLTAEHAQELRDALGKWIEAARRTGGRRRGRPNSGPRAQDIRDWCAREGIEVNQRGRIPVEIRDRYLAATGN